MSRIKVIDKTKVEQAFRIIMGCDAFALYGKVLHFQSPKAAVKVWMFHTIGIDEV